MTDKPAKKTAAPAPKAVEPAVTVEVPELEAPAPGDTPAPPVVEPPAEDAPEDDAPADEAPAEAPATDEPWGFAAPHPDGTPQSPTVTDSDPWVQSQAQVHEEHFAFTPPPGSEPADTNE